MENEGKTPSLSPPPLSPLVPLSEVNIDSELLGNQVSDEAAVQSADDRFRDVEEDSEIHQDQLLEEEEAPSDVANPLTDTEPQNPSLGEAMESSGSKLFSDDLRVQIVRQVEYYFSDENLPTDKFLLKYMKRNKEGFIPIAVIASFRKMKKLVQDLSLIVSALRTSSKLVVSLNGKSVKRLHPLPHTEIKDAKPCTVIVENLPEDCSTDSIRPIFGSIGNIVNITIRDPRSIGESIVTRNTELTISSKVHALVEYETIKAAENAVATLNDQKNWSGMRVELLLKRMGKYGLVQKGHKEKTEKNTIHAADIAEDGLKIKSVDHYDAMAETEEPKHVVGAKGGQRNRYRSRGRGHLQHNANGHGHGSSSIGEGTMNKTIPGPKMPDGTRGFAMGRGKAPINDHDTLNS